MNQKQDRTRVRLEAAFAALADPKRLAVVNALRKRPRRAGELADIVSANPAALSRHLRVLRRSGLVTEGGLDTDARVRLYRLNPGGFASIQDWVAEIEGLWTDQLSAFKAYAEQPRPRRAAAK